MKPISKKDYNMIITVSPGALGGELPAIASKSCAHRLLICAALSKLPSFISCRTVSEDILATASCLRALGAGVRRAEDGFAVTPIGMVPKGAVLDCGESGSTLRFMLPVCCALGADCRFEMGGRLPQRPLSPLYEELCRHGAELSEQGASPLKVGGRLCGNDFTIPGGVSSQFVSGLLLALPIMGGGTVTLTGRTESAPYIQITADCMRKAGVKVAERDGTYTVSGSYDVPERMSVEGDWSNAAFWLCAGVLGKNPVSVRGLDVNSVQGDRKIVDIIQNFGGKIETSGGKITAFPSKLNTCAIDAGDVPDLVPVLSVLSCAALGETRIYNAARLRLKESDRLAAVSDLIGTLGCSVRQTEDGLVITGAGRLRGGSANSWNDHRIAMSAAVASIIADGPVTICGAECVNKSYPGFFDDFAALGGIVSKEE